MIEQYYSKQIDLKNKRNPSFFFFLILMPVGNSFVPPIYKYTNSFLAIFSSTP